MSAYDELKTRLRGNPETWLVTGAAGFIGSHLVETLLSLGQRVRAMDNLQTGRRANIDAVLAATAPENRARFDFIEGDIRDGEMCQRACDGVKFVLHQAGLGSVPRSLAHPADTHAANVTGTLNMLVAARDKGAARLVYASSSSVYGDDETLPKIESRTGQPLSPYAVSKTMCESYSKIFARCFGFESVGLRYFNVFGPRQDPDGPYAAVMPKWIDAMRKHRPVFINGDGSTSRDFCYVANVVQANLLAATSSTRGLGGRVFNIARGDRTDLNELFHAIRDNLATRDAALASLQPVYQDFRAGDIKHSLADVSAAREALGYEPTHDVRQGLKEALEWYWENLSPAA